MNVQTNIGREFLNLVSKHFPKKIFATAPAYSNKSEQCRLYLTEKLYLVRAKKPSLSNKITELIF